MSLTSLSVRRLLVPLRSKNVFLGLVVMLLLAPLLVLTRAPEVHAAPCRRTE